MVYLRLLVLSFLVGAIPPATGIHSEFAPLPGLASELALYDGDLSIVIQKSRYVLTLYKGRRPVKSYRPVFGKGYADGDKMRMGDKRTPEGAFFICSMNHSKRFYKFMGLSYPGREHADRGLAQGLISRAEYESIVASLDGGRQPSWDTRLGGAVGIHGRMLGDAAPHRDTLRRNWTDGCIALTNADVDEIFSVVSIGTPVYIVP
ncbi:MAG: hypothetical protein A2X56_07065 [Nitrospirae bacterium GWC2_57_13]|jgi:murein L,D-transpeptidase YafK|nr:MAG: hypothetical protein A2X56_07065 [Nitrospirae bacterium GWC2_57_13]HAR44768.1 hypothetical protein [Nitrospiraceae bacterium]